MRVSKLFSSILEQTWQMLHHKCNRLRFTCHMLDYAYK